MKKLLVLGLAIWLPTEAAYALTLVNDSGDEIHISNATAGATHHISSGDSFAVPASWGDARHLWFDAQLASGTDVCPTFEDRWGTIKMPAFYPAVSVAPSGACTPQDDAPPGPTATPAPSPTPQATPCPVEPCNPPNPGAPPRGNGTWVYDATFPAGPAGIPATTAGVWSDDLGAYNAGASAGHALNQIFSYGGDLEMECLGGADCTSNKMHVYYYPPTSQHAARSFTDTGTSGFQSTQAYVTTEGVDTVIPVFDGRFDGDGYLTQFATLDEAQARTYADIFARTVCADPAVAGVQLDLEPFNLSVPAQRWFYDQIALNLAGENEELEPVFQCVSDQHLNGRYFSAFLFADAITPELGEIFTRHGNGYVILSLYDLGPGSAGQASTPSAYGGYVAAEIERALTRSSAANDVPFQLAIPGAASTKEFESYDGVVSGYAQAEYVEAALDAIDASGARTDPRFLGTAVWGWSRYMAYPPHSEHVFEPAHPPADVLTLLRDRL